MNNPQTQNQKASAPETRTEAEQMLVKLGYTKEYDYWITPSGDDEQSFERACKEAKISTKKDK